MPDTTLSFQDLQRWLARVPNDARVLERRRWIIGLWRSGDLSATRTALYLRGGHNGRQWLRLMDDRNTPWDADRPSEVTHDVPTIVDDRDAVSHAYEEPGLEAMADLMFQYGDDVETWEPAPGEFPGQ